MRLFTAISLRLMPIAGREKLRTPGNGRDIKSLEQWVKGLDPWIKDLGQVPARPQRGAKVCSGAARRYGGRGAHSIEAPLAAAGDPEVEEDKAVDDCQLPAVEQREETSRRVHHEIGDGHVAREDKGDGASEQTQREKQTADQLQ
jgi:hypothetical protein